MIIKHWENVIFNGNLDVKEFFEIEKWTSKLIEETTPQLMYLVEPSVSSEDSIGSILSTKSGNPYEQIYESASWSKLNERYTTYVIILILIY